MSVTSNTDLSPREVFIVMILILVGANAFISGSEKTKASCLFSTWPSECELSVELPDRGEESSRAKCTLFVVFSLGRGWGHVDQKGYNLA